MSYRDKEREAAYKRNRRRTNPVERKFVGWDGEGYSIWVGYPDGRPPERRHFYMLFGNTEGVVRTDYSLSTVKCLEAILSTANARGVINIAFAFDYDTNMIIRDLPYRVTKRLKENGFCYWKGYRIEHRPHKWFQVSRRTDAGNRISVRIYDIFSFFGTSFVEACKAYIGETPELLRIQEGKEHRSTFYYSDLADTVYPYWLVEGKYLVELANRLRLAINKAGLKITSWHGPGAVATALFKKYDVKSLMDRDIPKEVNLAARYAYSSGRFEPFRGGYYPEDIWIADINSAYPYALSRLPRLDNGKWQHTNSAESISALERGVRLGIFRVRYTGKGRLSYSMRGGPMPYFYRSADNRIHYPCIVEGWYMAPEAWLGYRFDKDNTEIVEGWIYHDDGSSPFGWIAELFHERQKLKAEGNPGEKGVKLGLNSAYGKMAQRIGWNEETRRPPVYHQLEWAGTITATCRAMLYTAMLGVAKEGGLISADTDGIISSTPFKYLPNGEGNGLGEWEVKKYTGILYLQNGIYWLRDSSGNWLPPKSRGIPRASLDFDAGIAAFRNGKKLVVHQQQFIGYGTALRGRWDDRSTWVRVPKVFEFGGSGKRVHNPSFCTSCRYGRIHGQSERSGLHNFILSRPEGGISSPHNLPWMDGFDDDAESPFNAKRWDILNSDLVT